MAYEAGLSTASLWLYPDLNWYLTFKASPQQLKQHLLPKIVHTMYFKSVPQGVREEIQRNEMYASSKERAITQSKLVLWYFTVVCRDEPKLIHILNGLHKSQTFNNPSMAKNLLSSYLVAIANYFANLYLAIDAASSNDPNEGVDLRSLMDSLGILPKELKPGYSKDGIPYFLRGLATLSKKVFVLNNEAKLEKRNTLRTLIDYIYPHLYTRKAYLEAVKRLLKIDANYVFDRIRLEEMYKDAAELDNESAAVDNPIASWNTSYKYEAIMSYKHMATEAMKMQEMQLKQLVHKNSRQLALSQSN